VNKTDLINQLAARLDGDKKVAQTAVEGIIDLVQREVQRGENVSISGFGVFEKRARAARTARNPRTGQAVKVKKTTVPAFRPGKYFKDVIAGTVKLPKVTAKPTTARAAAAAAKTPVTAKAPVAAKTAAAPRTRAAVKPAVVAAAAKPAPRARVAAKPAAAPAPAVKVPRAAAAKAAPAKAAAAPKAAPAKAAPAAKAPAARRAPAKKK
jgi:DNA-binding protein HU-beta